MMLKYEDVREIDRWEFDRFVELALKDYGRTWNIMDSGYDGFHQDTYLSARVERDREPEEDIEQNFDRWLDGGSYYDEPDKDAPQEEWNDFNRYMRDEIPGFQEMMQWLCNKGYAPEGKYVIHIWW